jgi:SAM-dependent methyltransferase
MIPPCGRRSFLLAASSFAALPALARTRGQDMDVPYVPTPTEVVEAMLDMAALKPGERLIDLGSGDGRIPIAAARRGATALGVEIDSRLVSRARSLAGMAGQDARAKFLRDDLFTVSLHAADIVTLYLLPAVNERLKPKILTEMKAGARVVSHAFDMGDWPPDAYRSVTEKHVYLWIVPAIAGGEWRLTRADGSTALLAIEQRYSRIAGTLDGRPIGEPKLSGAALAFTADGIRYAGTVGDRAITSNPPEAWRAERVE